MQSWNPLQITLQSNSECDVYISFYLERLPEDLYRQYADIVDAEWRYVDQVKRIGFVRRQERLECNKYFNDYPIYHKHFSCHETVELPDLPEPYSIYKYNEYFANNNRGGPTQYPGTVGPQLTIFVK